MYGIMCQVETASQFQIRQLLFISQLETEEIKKVLREGE